MTQNPQDIIADHCVALLGFLPNDAMLICARELAHHNIATHNTLATLCSHLCSAIPNARDEDVRACLVHFLQLGALLGPDDVPVPVTVAEIRDEDDQPIYRVTNVAGTQLHAWLERKGWESTGWTLASDFDDIGPVPGREDLPRGAWPVGLAKLVADALAELDTSEPWEEP